MRSRTPLFIPAGALLAVLGLAGAGWGQVFCNLDRIEAKPLANGVQISVHADGILEWRPPNDDWNAFWSGEKKSEVVVRFPQARSKLDSSFINVGVPPVSHIQVSVPQNAQLGIGLEMKVVLSDPSRYDVNTAPDQQTWMITFLAERTVDRSAPAAKGDSQAAGEGTIDVRSQDGLVWLRCTNADIHRVVGEVAHQGGINAAVDDAVQHRVSVRLSGLKPLEVLRGIAAGYGLSLSTDGDVIMISEGVPRDMATYNRSSTASFPMRHLRAAEAQGLLPTFLFS